MPPKFRTVKDKKCIQKLKTLNVKRTEREEEVRRGVEKLSVSGTYENPSRTIGHIDPRTFYLSQLRASKRFFSLSKKGFFAVADCTKDGNLIQRYCILQKLTFSDGHKYRYVYTCSCGAALTQQLRLLGTNPTVCEEDLDTFVTRETDQYCIHSSGFEKLVLSPGCTQHNDSEFIEEDEEDVEECIEQLSTSPLIIAVYANQKYGILHKERSEQRQKFRCLTCERNVHSCIHVDTYKQWVTKNNIFTDDDFDSYTSESEVTFKSVSYRKIPCPLPEHLKEKHDKHEGGQLEFPEHLIPNSVGSCKHGNLWDERDPVHQGWVRSKNVTIYKESVSITLTSSGSQRQSYFRPTDGDTCDCILEYDGQEDLLFNLDNKHFLYYGLLFHYLHAMVETGSPLASLHRVCTGSTDSTSKTCVIPLHILRRGWNAFARLLDINWENSFTCHICGDQPDAIICDATSLGVRKDLLPHLQQTHKNSQTINGSKHQDRVYIKTLRARQLLIKFCGVKGAEKRGQKTTIHHKCQLSKQEFQQLIKLLREEGKTNLADLLRRLTVENDNVPLAKSPYREFLFEMALNAPACGAVQIAGDAKAKNILSEVVTSTINIKESVNHSKLSYLQKKAPLFASFLTDLDYARLPADIGGVLQDVLIAIDAPFSSTESSSPNAYPPITDKKFDFFPTLPQQHGPGSYAADGKNSYQHDGCRKESWGHPVLSPGIFTIYCKHGICYGFSLMESNESPKMPFEIFKTRFKVAPRLVVYDNACKLHQYALNREPHFFRNTCFAVDRFHWKGHKACPIGYNLSAYGASMDIAQLNSQVNEQGNAGVKKLKGHLSYMLPENFMFHVFLYYARKNQSKQKAMLS